MPGLPVSVFGAFDRHNFGDLLFPHIVGALLSGRRLQPAGVVARDLRPWGGHRVVPIGELSPCSAAIHGGGEILSCTAWEAAVMVADAATARRVAAELDGNPANGAAWAAERLGRSDLAPYVLSQADAGAATARIFNAVGGAGLGTRPPAMIDEVVGKLRDAAFLAVRDRETRDFLARHGIAAALAPDPAVLIAELFGSRIARHWDRGATAKVRGAFPAGYLALQFSADFGDDATLDALAGQLARLPADLGIVAFCAGAAPWHDDPQVYRRLLARLSPRPTLRFPSLHLWNICALLSAARAYAGSSLHGRIVASAFGVPAVSLARPGDAANKVAAYLETWEPWATPVEPADLLPALDAVLASDPARRRQQAADLGAAYRACATTWLKEVPPLPGRDGGRTPGTCARKE